MKKDFTTYSNYQNDIRFELMQMSSFTEYNIEENIPERLRIIFIKKGNGRIIVNGNPVLWFAPAIICLDEKAICSGLNNIQADVFYFHPCALNQNIDFINYRDYSNNSVLDVVRNRLLLKVFLQPVTVINHIDSTKLTQLSSIFGSLNEELNTQPTDWWPCRCRSYMSELLFLIAQLFESQKIDTSMQNKQYFSEKIQKAVDFILDYYKDKITLSDIASTAGTNRTTLNTLFKKETGKTAVAYLIEVRVRIASNMLVNTQLPISEISQRTGFSDVSYFESQFKKLFNVSPVNYRAGKS